MYDNIKLEKGLYNLSGKSFVDVLEEQDPSENYVGTPMEKLDAFERQLKRFDIKLNGKHCDKVEKFFTTTESAVLFPEYIKRCIIQGIEDNHFDDVIAVKTVINSTSYRGTYINDGTSYSSDITAGGVIPESVIYENASPQVLGKLGRMINAPYEVVRQQNLDIVSIQLRIIGRKLGRGIYSKILTTIEDNADSVNASSNALSYDDLIKLYAEFTNYDMNVLIASPITCAKILNISELKDCCCTHKEGDIILPFGAKLIKSTSIDDNTLYALDKNFAIEYVTSTELFMETDNVINRQLDRLSVSTQYLFRCLEANAMKVLNIPAK